jgi:cytidine deaminase
MTSRVQVSALTDDDRELIDRANQARPNGYAPYSHFLVGAAVRGADGRIFAGANLENASYGLTMCAEVGALTAANTAGCNRIAAVAIVGRPEEKPPARDQFTTPCGRCRQLIFEAAQRAEGEIKVISVAQDGTTALVATIQELLPEAFGPADVGAAPQLPPRARTARG